ncbi:MAG: BatD family protein [Tannerella sp.]|jgi:hypothetical protein|nr:BatD family protein [Tannerella sp.]
MEKKINFLLILLLYVAFSHHVKADDVTFRGSAPPAVAMGSQFQLAYVVNVSNSKDLRLPPSLTENFDLLMGPSVATSGSMQIINGKRTSSITTTYTCILMPKKEGTFELEPATVKIGNSEYKSNAITIKVLPPNQAVQAQQGGGGQRPQQRGGGENNPASSVDVGENLFLRMIISDRSVYEQEGFLVTFKLYTAYGQLSVDDVKFPEFEGFLAQEIELKDHQWTLENYNGMNYQSVVLKQTVLYPQRSGKIEIGRGKVRVILRVRNQSRSRSFFDSFFDYQDVAKEVFSQPVTIDVKSLPTTGKPASFSGAVGSYAMSSDINKTELKANEAVTIKLTIKGNGNIKLLKNPEVKFPNDFEVYDPKVDNNIRVSAAGASGTKTIEYMAIPRFAGDFEIPAIHFSYFDTKAGAYKTLSSESFRLHVEKGEGGSDAPVVSNYTNRENVKFLGKDIRYIKVGDVHFISNKEIFFGSFLYVMAYLMIAILFIVFFIIYRKQVKENSNIALVRTKKANKTAVKRLKQAGKLLKEDQEEAFYEEVLRALWGYLSDKLNISQAELTKENVAAELTKYGVDETLSEGFLDIINTCEFARYAPSRTSGTMDKLFAETIEAIDKMENTIKK